MTHITKENFQEEVSQSPVITLIDFWAEWCGPCRMLAPVLDEVATALGDKAKICKVDVDSQSELAAKFGVMSIPTMVIFENGKEINKIVGLRSREELLSLLVK